jgi:Bacterial Ig domain/Domain of unknown function (DUF5011)
MIKNIFAGAFFAIILVSIPVTTFAINLDLFPSQDAWIEQLDPNRNHGDVNDVEIKSKNLQNERGLVQFSLSPIPLGSTIQSAVLKMYLNITPGVSRQLNLSPVSSLWIEGNGGVDNNPTGEVTWTNQPTVGSVVSSTTTGTTDGVYLYFDVTSSVQNMLSGSSANNGWMIIDNTEDSAVGRTEDFRSKDFATSLQRPLLQIVYTPANTAPVSTDIATTTDEDVVKNILLLSTDTDVPTQTISYSVVSGPVHGTLSTISGNQITYTPNQNYNGTDSFSYKANDGVIDGNTSNVNITINPVNDTPLITLLGSTTVSVVQDDAFTDLGATSTDVEDGIINPVVSGVVDVHTPGTYNLVYTATDFGSLSASTTRVVIITPKPVSQVETTVVHANGGIAGSFGQVVNSVIPQSEVSNPIKNEAIVKIQPETQTQNNVVQAEPLSKKLSIKNSPTKVIKTTPSVVTKSNVNQTASVINAPVVNNKISGLFKSLFGYIGRIFGR